MAYKVNGVDITLQPETGKWNEPNQIGIDGNGHAVYSAPFEFEMKWGFMSMSEFAQLRTFFLSVGATGSSVVDLPQYGNTSYTFRSYSGCVLRQPEAGVFFEEFVSDCRLLVTKITV